MKTPGALIRERRKEKRLSQGAVGDHVGVSQATISQIEAGNTAIGPELVPGLAQILGIPLAELLESIAVHSEDKLILVSTKNQPPEFRKKVCDFVAGLYASGDRAA